jgi:hypothetical protein
MEKIINQLKEQAGLTDEQALKAIDIIKGYIQTKLPPAMHGMVDNFLKDEEE